MKKVANVLKISFIINTFLAILKVVVGTIGSSGALIADGFHSISDLVTDIVVIISSKFSDKKADREHPFGHGRIDYIISIAIALVIVMLGITIIIDSIQMNFTVPSILVVIVSIITIGIKLILSNYIINKGKLYKSNVLISSGLESRSDVATSVVVLVSSLLMRFSEKIEVLKYSNIIAMMVVGAFIIKTGVNILKENLSILIGSVENDEEVLEKIRKIISKNKEIKKIDVLTLMKYGMYYHLICEVSMDANLKLIKAHDIAHELEDHIKKTLVDIEYITIHINPYKKDVES